MALSSPECLKARILQALQAVQLETKFLESKTEAIRLQLQNEEHLVKLRHHEQAMLLLAQKDSNMLHLSLTQSKP